MHVKEKGNCMSIFSSVFKNKQLTVYLAKNDMKNKFAGSYLGVLWAFVQPVITILLYWFVFQVGLRSSDVGEVPFVMWLMAGLIPWFFFQEAVMNATNSFIEYNYLVKKVVFNIDILPVVKVVSASFIHMFFLVVLVLIYAAFGYFPGVICLQLLYYSLAMMALVLSIAYLTSAIAVFFKDMMQLVGVLMQVGVWATPIMWNINSLDLPKALMVIFRLNPMFYIVNGYRTTLIDKKPFWELGAEALCFWGIVIILYVVGTSVYKRLKPHFADSL